MDFRSIYQHGFARVAACTGSVAVADPPANAEMVLRGARECAEEGVVVALFPELSADRLLARGPRAAGRGARRRRARARHRGRGHRRPAAADRRRRAAAPPQPDLQLRRRHPPRARSSASSRSPTRRPTASSTRGGSSPPASASAARSASAAPTCPFGTDLLFAAEDVPGLVVHAEVCEDMWIPIPPSAEAALAGATVLLNLSGSPITVGRAEDRKLLCRSASSRCLAAYVYSAAGQGESTTDLAWDGQTTIYENGVLLAETERFQDGDRRAVADVDLDLLLQERRAHGHVRRQPARARAPDFRRIGFTLDPPDARPRPAARASSATRSSPPTSTRLDLDCYEAYNIQVAGLHQRLRAIGDPKVVIGVSGGLDSTQALLVAAQAMDRAGRPRSDILGFTLPGFATSDGHQGQRAQADGRARRHRRGARHPPTAKLMLEEIGHPFARGEEVYDVTFENVQAGLRTDYLFRIANQRGGIVLGTGDLSELALGWATYGVGDQMSHYNVNGGVPEDVHPAPDPLGDQDRAVRGRGVARRWRRSSTPRSAPSSCRARSCSRPSRRSAPTRCTTSRSSTRCATASGPRRSASWPGTPGATRRGRRGRRTSRTRSASPTTGRRSAAGSSCSAGASSRSPSSSARRCPTGRRCRRGGSLSPRGDWRAPSDGSAGAWLRDLARFDDAGGWREDVASRTPQG